MSKYRLKPIDLKGLKTYSLHDRIGNVNIDHFAHPFRSQGIITKFVDSLPNILAGKDFKELIKRLYKAKLTKKPIIVGMGAHVIKVGLSPVIIALMEEGWITAVCMNGAGIVHDFEIAFSGKTSEDVKAQIEDGSFGMSEETGRLLNSAINNKENSLGIGEKVGKMISNSNYPYKNQSILAAAYKIGIPVTIHVAIGTDIIHFHPDVDGETLGRSAMTDYLLFCSIIKELNGGGVFLNIGSAVILPEVFLKAVSVVRNLGVELQDFTTAVFDFIRQYRPYQNIVDRPVTGKGKGFYFTGHHEIMIPLLASVLLSQ